MIDTDKYEGHTPAPWEWPEEDSILLKGKYEKYIITGRHLSGDSIDKEADAALIADAPLLLEEVKRLQERLDWILGDEELASYVWEKEVAYMEWEGVRLPWISADEWGEEE